LARQSQLPMRLAAALTIFARVSHRDDPDAAERALDEVVAMGPEAAGTWMVGWALSVRAEFRVAAGDTRSALALLTEALHMLGDDATYLTVVRTACIGAAIFEVVGEPDTAAMLAGAATGGHHAMMLRYTLEQPMRIELDRTIDRLRATLGAGAYDAAATQGAAMSSDDLLRFLIRATDNALAAARE
jgi:ATP/maltotriose-dependent transcriptional regulator MalT